MDQQLQLYKSGIEALLFVSDKPIVLDQFKTVFPELKPAEITELVKQLQQEYVDRKSGMVIVDIAAGWQMLSNSHAAGFIKEFYKTKTKEKLSRPALESLAIIAYKQPVGRAELEIIRGVNCDGTVAHLLNKGLIEIVGRKEVPGRPFLYGTTKAFLEYFGLRCLEDLPKLADVPLNSPAAAAAGDAPLGIVNETPALEGDQTNENSLQKQTDLPDTQASDVPEVIESSIEESLQSSEITTEAFSIESTTQESSGQARIMQEQTNDQSLS